MSEATVLVVDDEEYIRDLVTSSLRLAGFTARSMPDGPRPSRRSRPPRPTS
jgi:DNA-binding response OmpR family regulator